MKTVIFNEIDESILHITGNSISPNAIMVGRMEFYIFKFYHVVLYSAVGHTRQHQTQMTEKINSE